MPGRERTFYLTNAVANRIVIARLNTSAGVRLGRRLAVVDYVLVAQYVRRAETVHIDVGMAEHTTWWRNFHVPLRVHVGLT